MPSPGSASISHRIGLLVILLLGHLACMQENGNPDAGIAGDGGAGDRQSGDLTGSDCTGSDSGREVSLGEGILGGVLAIETHVDSQTPRSSASLAMRGPKDKMREGTIFAVAYDGVFEVDLEAGSCVYLVLKEWSFCEPQCQDDFFCNSYGECEVSPRFLSAGDLTIEGLNVPINVTQDETGYLTEHSSTENLFESSSQIAVSASGDVIPAFDLETMGVGTMDPLPCDQSMPAATDFTLQWSNAESGARIRFELISMMHAGNGPMVLCEADDTGSITVPAAIIDRYLLDRTAYQTWILTRYSRDLTEVASGSSIALEVASKRVCFFLP